MAKDDENLEVEETETDDVEVEHSNGEVHNRLAGLEASQLQTIMSIPEVQKVLQAKMAGKTLKIIEEGEEEPEVEPETPPEASLDEILKDVPADDPARKAVERALGAVDAKINARLAKLARIEERLEGVESVAKETRKQEVVAQVKAARAKFPDFDKHSKKALEISGENPGLSVEELYLISKARSEGGLKLRDASTFSERPSGQPQRSEQPKPRKTPLPAGRRGFTQLLDEALKDFSLKE